MTDNANHYDAIILGGGPSGSTAGIKLARMGYRVLILEKQTHPRFHVGESMMPVMLEMTRQLGLGERCDALPQVPKNGAEFAFPMDEDEETLRFSFTEAMSEGPLDSLNIERSHYDKLLIDGAKEAGCEVLEGTRVEAIETLEHNNVAVRYVGGRASGRWLLDATGQATLLAKHLGTKNGIPNLRKTAFFGHFTDVDRLAEDEEGYPTIVMFEEGWFWIIPINETVTSCGLVLDQDAIKKAGFPTGEMFRWAAERTPLMARRLRNATFPAMTSSNVISDYSYKCDPYAGPGYFLVGDAASFLDPIFSTGVALGMAGAIETARLVVEIDAGTTQPDDARQQYKRFIDGSSKHLFSLVHSYYDHSFRELMMNGSGPAEMHRAVISLLAGHVFPKPAWKLVWRLRYMQLCAKLQRMIPLVKRHKRHSLFDAEAKPIGSQVDEPAPAERAELALN